MILRLATANEDGRMQPRIRNGFGVAAIFIGASLGRNQKNHRREAEGSVRFLGAHASCVHPVSRNLVSRYAGRSQAISA